MPKFALIGKTLKHSYSKKIHSLLDGYSYDLVELEEDKVKDFVLNGDFDGYNVTIPYKKTVMPYLDEIDEYAKLIGSVNTVINRDGKIKGYNTDFFGMDMALKRTGINLENKCIMIVGSGGTAATAYALAQYKKAKKIIFLSRTGEVNYQNYHLQKDVEIILNTSPVGMFPNNYDCLIDLSLFPKLEGVFDAIYNPNMTKFLYQAKELNIKCSNGLAMLVAQAKKAMEYFLDKKEDDKVIDKVLNSLIKETSNIVLIGMAGSGKSTIAKLLAQKLDREVIDIDLEIEKREKKSIPEIFKDCGEEYFRQIEKEVIKDIGKQAGKIIATGGGAIKDNANYFSLKQNGIIFYIKRDVELLATENRPLSKNLDAIKELFEQRKSQYEKFADYIVDNNSEIDKAIGEIIKIYENFSY